MTKKEKEEELRKEVDPPGSFPEAFRIGLLQALSISVQMSAMLGLSSRVNH